MCSNLSINSFLSIIITLILIQAPTTFCENNGTSPGEYITCGKPFNCANAEGIGYPFWGGNRPAFCGHPGFELNCRNDFPEISIQSVQYRIFNISNHAQTANIARNDLLNNICPLHLQNASLDFNLFNYVPSGYHNITLFYGCTVKNRVSIHRNPDVLFNLFNCSEDNHGQLACNSTSHSGFGSFPTPSIFNCSGDESDDPNCIIFKYCSEGDLGLACNGTGRAKFGSVPGIFNCSEGNSSLNGFGLGISPFTDLLVNITCGNEISATVGEGGFEDLGKASGFSEEVVRSSIASGFPVQWRANDEICKECVRSGGRCGSSGMKNSTEFVCFCVNGTSSSICSQSHSHSQANSYNNRTIGQILFLLAPERCILMFLSNFSSLPLQASYSYVPFVIALSSAAAIILAFN
nr:LEAF RUST 10 DISEASE-RESISTANCE LOCUS RECEPTOR-LIKE PROTEIN KINASE-like 2.1 [Ipomoea batatas]GME19364.1 LEAF RUST 10 DISEASE-RESISTANCE LOCUS RECEPTOR-LIKE PROTEIN KINASE-like 2.1 [Ipomoea batatas]